MSSDSAQIKVGAWLAPSVALMQRFRMPAKLWTMAALLIIPLVVVTYFQVVRLTADYETAKDEVLGARIVSVASELVTEVQHHRVESIMAANRILRSRVSGPEPSWRRPSRNSTP